MTGISKSVFFPDDRLTFGPNMWQNNTWKGREGQTGQAEEAVSRAGAVRWVAKVTELM